MQVRLSLLLIAVLFSCAPLAALPVTFIANLDGPSESPANASPGTGFVQVIIDSDANTMRVIATFSGLVAGNTAAHIHVINGPGDTNTSDTLGPVATTTPTFSGFPTGATAGAYDQTFDMTLASSYRAGWITDSGGTTALAETQLFSGIAEGRAYFNIHSSTFPGGEIRDFLAEIPEPGTLGMLCLGLAGLVGGALGRARKNRGA